MQLEYLYRGRRVVPLQTFTTRHSKGHRFCYQSKAHIRLPITTIARRVLHIKSLIYESARNLYHARRAVPLQTLTTRHSYRKLSIVMALSTTFTQCASETTKFGKITQNKGHFVVQGHSMPQIFGTNRKLIHDFLSVIKFMIHAQKTSSTACYSMMIYINVIQTGLYFVYFILLFCMSILYVYTVTVSLCV